MSVLGAIGGIGGVGSSGGAAAAYSAADTGPIQQAAAPTAHWYASTAVMQTTGAVQGSQVSLNDHDFGRAGIGTLERERPDQRIALPPLQPARPTAEVANRVASVYAANRLP